MRVCSDPLSAVPDRPTRLPTTDTCLVHANQALPNLTLLPIGNVHVKRPVRRPSRTCRTLPLCCTLVDGRMPVGSGSVGRRPATRTRTSLDTPSCPSAETAASGPCLTRFRRFGPEIADVRGSDRRNPWKQGAFCRGIQSRAVFFLGAPCNRPNQHSVGCRFLRRTRTGGRKGRSYSPCRWVESVRRGNRVRQQTLLHLGTDVPIKPELWGRSLPANGRDPQPAVHLPAGLPAQGDPMLVAVMRSES